MIYLLQSKNYKSWERITKPSKWRLWKEIKLELSIKRWERLGAERIEGLLCKCTVFLILTHLFSMVFLIPGVIFLPFCLQPEQGLPVITCCWVSFHSCSVLLLYRTSSLHLNPPCRLGGRMYLCREVSWSNWILY